MRKAILCMVAFCVMGGTAYAQEDDPAAAFYSAFVHQMRTMELRAAEEEREAAEAARYAAMTDGEVAVELNKFCPMTLGYCAVDPPEALEKEAHRRGLLAYTPPPTPPNRGIDCVTIGGITDCR
jgi:hypothetical protein